MEYKVIELSDWILSGDGKEGESYVHKTDNTKLLKLYHENFNSFEAEHELEMAVIAYKLGIPSPLPGELVCCGKRKGITFNKIQNKRSLCRVISQEPERLKEMAQSLVKMSKDLHAMKITEDCGLKDYRMSLKEQCSTLKLDPRIKAAIEKVIDKAPAPDCYNHGDLHFGNAVTDGEREYFIDLGRFKTGTADYDISTLYFVCNMIPSKQMKENFHISVKEAKAFWKEFIDAYYPGTEKEEHLKEIRRWGLIKAELICPTLGLSPILFYILTGNFKALFERKRLS